MKFIKKNLFLILLLILFSGLLFSTALAQVDIDQIKDNLNKSADTAGVPTGNDARSIPTIIGQFINALFGLLGVVFLGYALLGGLLWMIAGGNEEKVARAKKFITGGVEGMIVIFLAYSLVYVVFAALDFASPN